MNDLLILIALLHMLEEIRAAKAVVRFVWAWDDAHENLLRVLVVTVGVVSTPKPREAAQAHAHPAAL